MKNKFFGIVLMTAMTVAVSGCGKQVTPEENISEETVAETSVEASIEESVPETVSEDEIDVPFTDGTVDGNVYENEYFGMTFTVPEDYSFVDDNDIENVTGYIADRLKNNIVITDAIDSGAAYVVANAGKDDSADNLCAIVFSNEALADPELDEQEGLNAFTKVVTEFFEADGAEITDTEISEGSIDDEKFYVIELDGSYDRSELKEKVVVFHKADHVIALAATCLDGDDPDHILSRIEKN